MLRKPILAFCLAICVSSTALPAAPAGQSGNSTHLEAIGALSAAFAFQTFLNIGMLADAHAKGVYDKEKTKPVLGSVMHFIRSTTQHLTAVQKTPLTAEDRKYVSDLIGVCNLLKAQGEALSTHIDSPSETTGPAFEKARQASWAEIRRVLGIKE